MFIKLAMNFLVTSCCAVFDSFRVMFVHLSALKYIVQILENKSSVVSCAQTLLLCKNQPQEAACRMLWEESSHSRPLEADGCLEICPRRGMFILFLSLYKIRILLILLPLHKSLAKEHLKTHIVLSWPRTPRDSVYSFTVNYLFYELWLMTALFCIFFGDVQYHDLQVNLFVIFYW